MAPQLFELQKRCTSLKDWRDTQRLSQLEAAEIFGISQKTYSLLERGHRYAKGPVAKRIVAVTGLPLAQVVGAA